jgi:hypothetical protein
VRISRTRRGLIAGTAIVTLFGLAPVAAAQTEATAPTCALVSADEVSSVVGAAIALNENSSGYYCSLGEGSALTISLVPETELEEMKADFGGGGEDVTVAGHPAWWQESSGNYLVAANGSVLFLKGWGIAETAADKLTHLTAVAELILPRVPASADPDLAARLNGLMPATIGGEALDVEIIPGWYVIGTADASRPEMKAVHDLLAAQGRSSADLVVVAGAASSGSSAIVMSAPGLDGSTLLIPLLAALLPAADTAPASTVELGGKQVTRVEVEPVLYAYASGDLVAYASGPDDSLGSFFASLP